ncbi:MAG: PDZ domain-containing protein [Rhodanobacter sp.]
MRGLAGSLVLGLGLFAGHVHAGMPAAIGTITLPLDYTDARLYVPVTIGNDPSSYTFILDTGAVPTGIDDALARKRSFAVSGAGMASGAGAGATRVGSTGPLSLHVGAAVLNVASLNVSPYDALLAATSGRRVDGIIGSQFFIEHVVTIDVEQRRITLHDPATWRYAGKGARIPITFKYGVPIAEVSLMLPDGRHIAAHAALDLGAKSTFLVPEPFIDRYRLREAFPRTVTMGLGAGMGGDTRYAFARGTRIALAASPSIGLDRPVIGLSVAGTLRSSWHDGLLGAAFLMRYRVTFDYAHQQMILEPFADASGLGFDRSGLFLVSAGRDLQDIDVREVVAGSPAAEAGLHPGDRLTAVDSKSVKQWRLWQLRDRLRDPTVGNVRIQVQRAQGAAEMVVHLRDQL